MVYSLFDSSTSSILVAATQAVNQPQIEDDQEEELLQASEVQGGGQDQNQVFLGYPVPREYVLELAFSVVVCYLLDGCCVG